MLMKLEPVDLCSYGALDWQGEVGGAGLACEKGARSIQQLVLDGRQLVERKEESRQQPSL